MSSDMMNPDGSVETQAYDPDYELPTYEEAFPALGGASVQPTVNHGQWTHTPKMTVKRSALTQVFRVPLEERRYKEMHEGFGDSGEQAKICQDIMTKNNVAIEMSLAKDQSLTVVITGKADSVMKARRQVMNQLQTQASVVLQIPKEHHRFILGKAGKNLQQLELDTATKINIPRTEENSDAIRITGTKEGIDKASHEIQLISAEKAKLAFERLPIPKIYHVFICGPGNSQLSALQEQTGARINVPPPSVMKDEIVVSGEKEGVHAAIQQIKKVYDDRKQKCQTVSVEVRKSQHKYVIGPRGSNREDILREFGVSVEVPPLDSPSETITLRGDSDKLGPALTMVYSKANSVVIAEVEAPAWLHRFIIGRKGANIRKITQDLPKVHIEFTDGQDKIVIEGPPGEVEVAQKSLQEVTRDLEARMAFAELKIDPKYHRHIIGKSGANVNRIKQETGVAIQIPDENDHTGIIRIEGSPAGVETAKRELMEMVEKMENERSKDIKIEQRFHRSLIGTKGENIREVRDKFNQVQITFPDAGKKSDTVTLRGPKEDVDRCHKYLFKMHQDLVTNNYQAEVHIFKQFHKNIIGKGGANIKKIRDETSTKIDLPNESSESDMIVITGKKADVDKAKKMIEQIQKELANISEITLDIPHKLHNSIIGAKGRLIQAIMSECGGVIIRFPPEGTASDKVVIRGPKADVENAKQQLMDLASEKRESSFTAEIRAKPEYHKFLIGRGGANIKKVRDTTGARIIFPNAKDAEQELITIMGRKDEVEKAKQDLEAKIKDLENIVEGEVNVDPKYHRHFVQRRGEVLYQIAADFGGVSVSFPRSGVKSERVVLKGSRDCVDGAKARILEIVSDLEQQVTIECVIAQKFHRTVMGAKGSKVQDITKTHDVGIKFPDRPVATEANGNGEVEVAPAEAAPSEAAPAENGTDSEPAGESDGGDTPRQQDIIRITGKQENCEAARDALLALVPITEEVEVPFDYHRFIIGQKGRDIRVMMTEHDVSISVPPSSTHSDMVKVTGAPAHVASAKAALLDKVAQLDVEKEDRELRSFSLEVVVDPKYHTKIIGQRGAVITRIRQDHGVNIQVPGKDDPRPDVVTVTGYERDANAAKLEIDKIVENLEKMTTVECQLDARTHKRIIGGRGKNIRKIAEDYRVDIKFPDRSSGDPNLVLITGLEEDVLDCKDYLLNLEEEYMQDITEEEFMHQYLAPPSKKSGEPTKKHNPGFKVKDAPWDATRDDDFPAIGSSVAPNRGASSWGPVRR